MHLIGREIDMRICDFKKLASARSSDSRIKQKALIGLEEMI